MPPTPAEPRLVLVTIDGLRASSLGAYGNTWFATPGLDRLAAESLLYDWRIVQSSDAQAQLRAWLAALGPGAWLLTDDAQAAATLEEGGDSPRLADVTLVDMGLPRTPAKRFEQTRAAMACAHFLDALPTGDAPAWLHLGVLGHAWDAPHEAALALCEPDDPAPAPSVSPASGGEADADARFAQGCRYAAQVMALDACVEALLEGLDTQLGAGRYDLALAGLRGYALGEHGVVGPADASGPYSEARHTPLVVRRADGDGALLRTGALVGDQELAGVVQRSGGLPGREALPLTGGGWRGLRTKDWLLIEQDARRELYVKPDDRWEANDVATRCEEALERLRADLGAQCQ
ncbi:hypothetical protein Pla175_08090 [Pirellulimonas nuda]|uniref:Sulfatase n=1 Tax=Pirellulimonas nuda TaxID=2528009 RepID=A0A518D7J1_9BACT|nr:hypothetical protein [Pirellulimonas nuda]QDU87447.1 hypothetical protein Pla175_08090 [Pirellulimonas nuda]